MIVLDAYALISMLAGGAAEREVRSLVDKGDTAVSTVNLIEVFDVCERVAGVPESELDRVLTPLLGGSIDVLSHEMGQARDAASIRVQHYHRTECPLSLADCALIAAATPGDGVATADRHVLKIAERAGRVPIALPAGG